MWPAHPVSDPLIYRPVRLDGSRIRVNAAPETTPAQWADKVQWEKAVEFATCEIEDEGRILRQWKERLRNDHGRVHF
ncbi:hypothetical protein GCM10028796_41560 [Ramlibacter monticola]